MVSECRTLASPASGKFTAQERPSRHSLFRQAETRFTSSGTLGTDHSMSPLHGRSASTWTGTFFFIFLVRVWLRPKGYRGYPNFSRWGGVRMARRLKVNGIRTVGLPAIVNSLPCCSASTQCWTAPCSGKVNRTDSSPSNTQVLKHENTTRLPLLQLPADKDSSSDTARRQRRRAFEQHLSSGYITALQGRPDWSPSEFRGNLFSIANRRPRNAEAI